MRRSRSQRFFQLMNTAHEYNHEYNIWTQTHTISTVDSTIDRIEHCYLKRLRCLEESACKKFRIQDLQTMRVEFRQDSKHQLMRRSISSYQSFDTHIAYRLDIHAQELVSSYYWTDRTIIYWEICKTINFAIINLEIILSSVIHLWCHASYKKVRLLWSCFLSFSFFSFVFCIDIKSTSEIDVSKLKIAIFLLFTNNQCSIRLINIFISFCQIFLFLHFFMINTNEKRLSIFVIKCNVKSIFVRRETLMINERKCIMIFAFMIMIVYDKNEKFAWKISCVVRCLRICASNFLF